MEEDDDDVVVVDDDVTVAAVAESSFSLRFLFSCRTGQQVR